ncbi:cytochrome P450 [Longispora sp. NPDC051575]|uniref:cytochrome P450 n=1 Tax=Longispora sp. NPDC051575 TaxID=3154943 RepID=UPI00342BFACD
MSLIPTLDRRPPSGAGARTEVATAVREPAAGVAVAPRARGLARAGAADQLRFGLRHRVPALLRRAPLPRRWAVRDDTVRLPGALLARFRATYGDAVWVRDQRGPALLVLGTNGLLRVLHGPAAPGHPHAAIVRRVIGEEVGRLLTARAVLTRAVFQNSVDRMARRIVLGDAAADDAEVTGLYLELRSEGNWLGTRPWRTDRARAAHDRLAERLRSYLDAAAPGSLVAALAADMTSGIHGGPMAAGNSGDSVAAGVPGAVSGPAGTDGVPVGQIAHWFLAFDILADTGLTTLVVLAGEPGLGDRARRDHDVARACVLETLRLWPPAGDLFRETTRDLDWDGEFLPAGTRLLVPAAFHERARSVADPDAFRPDIRDPWPGAGFFPLGPDGAGEDLGLLMATELVAQSLDRGRYRLLSAGLPVRGPLPQVLDPGAFRLSVGRR